MKTRVIEFQDNGKLGKYGVQKYEDSDNFKDWITVRLFKKVESAKEYADNLSKTGCGEKILAEYGE